jgi:hypothetical protein
MNKDLTSSDISFGVSFAKPANNINGKNAKKIPEKPI